MLFFIVKPTLIFVWLEVKERYEQTISAWRSKYTVSSCDYCLKKALELFLENSAILKSLHNET